MGPLGFSIMAISVTENPSEHPTMSQCTAAVEAEHSLLFEARGNPPSNMNL